MSHWLTRHPESDVGSFAVDGYRRSAAWRDANPAQRGCAFESYAHAERALFVDGMGFAPSVADVIPSVAAVRQIRHDAAIEERRKAVVWKRKMTTLRREIVAVSQCPENEYPSRRAALDRFLAEFR